MLMFWDVSIHKKYRNCATWARGILLSSEKSNYQLPCLRIAAKLRGSIPPSRKRNERKSFEYEGSRIESFMDAAARGLAEQLAAGDMGFMS